MEFEIIIGSKKEEETKQFLSEIKARTGAEIISIGNGPNREDLIYLK